MARDAKDGFGDANGWPADRAFERRGAERLAWWEERRRAIRNA